MCAPRVYRGKLIWIFLILFFAVSVRHRFPAQARGKTYPDTSGKSRFYLGNIDFADVLGVSVTYCFPAQARGILNRHLRQGRARSLRRCLLETIFLHRLGEY